VISVLFDYTIIVSDSRGCVTDQQIRFPADFQSLKDMLTTSSRVCSAFRSI